MVECMHGVRRPVQERVQMGLGRITLRMEGCMAWWRRLKNGLQAYPQHICLGWAPPIAAPGIGGDEGLG